MMTAVDGRDLRQRLAERLAALILRGDELTRRFPRRGDGEYEYALDDSIIPQAQEWLTASAALVQNLAPPKSRWAADIDHAIGEARPSGQHVSILIPSRTILKVIGILRAVKADLVSDSYERWSTCS